MFFKKKTDKSPKVLASEALVARVRDGDVEAAHDFFVELRRHTARRLASRYKSLHRYHEDFAAGVEELALRRIRDGTLPRESVQKLSLRFTQQVVKNHHRVRTRDKRILAKIWLDLRARWLLPKPSLGDDDHDDEQGEFAGAPMEEYWSPEMQELLDQIDGLPQTHREVLLAEANHQMGVGPEPSSALGITKDTYYVRLHRARAALLETREPLEKEVQDVERS